MLGKGSKVKILSRENKIGIVLEVKGDFVQVNYQNKTEWFPISDLLETTNELLSRLIKNDIDDEVNFVLAMDAYRLHTAQLWDPYVFASSTRIRIFPHQIDEVTWALDNPKTLIADEVGLGKTIIAALVSSELRARGLVNRVLYIVPKSLILKWQDELNEKFETDARILGSAYEKINSETFKQDDFSYIASIDYLKQDNILEYLSDAELDLIIIDEAHKLKLNTQRLKLGKILSNKTNFMMFLTATPHDGRDEDFLARMQLLDPYISDVPSSSYLWVRNIKEDVTDINGKEVFPPRTSETVEISLTFAEENIHTMLDVYMKQRAEEAHTPKDRNAVRFLSIIFRKRSSSSIKALGVTLKRRLAKLGTVNADAVLQNQRYIQGADGDDEDFDEDEFEERTNQAEGFTVGTDIEQEKIDLRKLIATVQELGDKDSKLEMLHDFIKNLKTKDPNAKLILFTEYRDTLDYLFNSLSEKYRVGKIYGSMDINERKKALNDFRDNDGPEVLVCTDAAGEGIDMQFCNIEINYDLPWNPNKLEQRMGRIHRIGQVRDVSYYNFIIKSEKSIDGYILGRLLEKIERIKEALKDKVYDVIGRLVSADDIAKLIEELSQIPSSMWEPRVTELLEKIEKTKERIIKENEQLLTSHRFDKTTLVDFHKSRKEAVDKGEVKRFVQTYVEIHEGNCQVVNQEDKELIIIQSQNIKKKEYRISTDEDKKIHQASIDYFKSKIKEFEKEHLLPDEDILPGFRREHMLWNYGIRYWKEYFDERQLLVLCTMAKKIDEIVEHVSDSEYRNVLSLFLNLMLIQRVDMAAIGVVWYAGREIPTHVLTFRQPSIAYNFAESNPFLKAAGSLEYIMDNIISSIQFCVHTKNSSNCKLESVTKKSSKKYDLIITDPPYGDDVIYGEFSEFFYIWAQRGLKKYFNELPSRVILDEDFCESWGRFGTKQLASEFFGKGLKKSFIAMSEKLKDDGLLVVFFANASPHAWNLFLNSIRDARFNVVSSFAIHTENVGNLIARGKTSFMSSVIVNCRKLTEQKTAYFEDIIPQTEDNVKSMIDKIPAEKILTIPITDLLIMVYGKVLETCTQFTELKSYEKDFKPDFETLIKGSQDFIMRELVAKLTGRNMNLIGSEMAFYLLVRIFYRGKMAADDAIKITRAITVNLNKLEKEGMITIVGGVTNLTPLQETNLELKPEELDNANLYQQLCYLATICQTKGASKVSAILSQSAGNIKVDELKKIVPLLIKSYRNQINKNQKLDDSEKEELKLLETIQDTWGGTKIEGTLDGFI